MKKTISLFCAAIAGWAQVPNLPSGEPRLKTRTEVAHPEPAPKVVTGDVWILPAGTKIPIQLRQPVSTKNAQPGDAIYAQTSFPVVTDGEIVIPAGTWVQGVVDLVRRAGRLKGTAELQFHLTTLIYPHGYTLNIAAAIDQVPGDETARMKEPGTVKRDSEKGKDLERVGTGASQGGQIGALAGVATRGSMRSLGVGGLSGIAAGTLIALLARGSDVRFDAGTAVEISLSHAMAIERAKVTRAATGAVAPQP
jgi:type IV secretion system protein VirB10